MKINLKILTICIILIGISLFIRFYQLGTTPTGLYWDEIAMYVDIKSILATSKDMHGRVWYQLIFPSYGDYKLPVYIWLATISSYFLGLSEFSFRLVSALTGIGTIIVAFFLSRELFSKHEDKNLISICISTMLAISPWSILFSRTGFEGHVAQFFLNLSILFLFYAKKKWQFLFLSVLAGTVATYTYFSVRFVWPFIFLAGYYLTIFNSSIVKEKSKKTLLIVSGGILGIILYFVLLIPFTKANMYSEMQQFRYGTDSVLKNDNYVHVTNFYRQATGDTYLDRMMFHRHYALLKELAKNYSDHLNLDYLFFSGDSNLRHGTGLYGLFLPSTIVFFFLGLYFLTRRHLKQLTLLIIWWLAALLPASVPENTPHALRSLNALLPLSIIIGYGFYGLIEICKTQKLKYILYTISCILIIELLGFSYNYFKVYPSISASAWQTGYKQWTEKLFSHRKNSEPMVIIPTDDKFYLWIMAYGPYSGNEFQTWKSNQFLFTNFDNITFGNVNALDNSSSQEFLLALPEKRLDEIRARNNYTYEIIEKFPILGDTDNFVIVRVEK